MNASQYAGTVIVPTLSRIVLCAAFFTAGWAKMFTEATYNAEEAQVLQKLGIDVTQSVAWNFSPGIIAASHTWELPAQDVPNEPPADPVDEPPVDEPATEAPSATDTAPAEPTPEISAPPTTVTPPTPVVTAPIEDGSLYKAPARYKVAIILDRTGWQYPSQLALIASLTELLGGALLLIGLFSRVWGLGLAIAMALAFHTTTMDPYLAAPFEAAEGRDGFALFHSVFAQLSLFVLAFGIFITGPGPLSLDRAIFRRGGPSEVEIDVDETV